MARIFTTNWTWEEFWPQDAFKKQHIEAVRRRVLWVSVCQPLPRHCRPARPPLLPVRTSQNRGECDEEEQLRALFAEDKV